MDIREYGAYDEEEILSLYQSVGWTAYTEDPAALRQGYENSLLTLAAYEGNRLLGVLRAVGDGQTVVFIQDILVFPEYQRKGVGSALLKELLCRFHRVRQIELVTDDTPNTVAFYQALGFRELSEIGCRGYLRCP